MKRIIPSRLLPVLLLALAAGWLPAAEDELIPPRKRPNVEELRARARKLSPEERQKLFQEFREKRGFGATNRTEWEHWRSELRQLPPAERQARIQEFWQKLEEEKVAKVRPNFHVLTPAEREAKRQQMKAAVSRQVTELRAKEKDGPLTEAEQRRLERMSKMARLLEQGAVLGPRQSPPPGGVPLGKPQDPLPRPQ